MPVGIDYFCQRGRGTGGIGPGIVFLLRLVLRQIKLAEAIQTLRSAIEMLCDRRWHGLLVERIEPDRGPKKLMRNDQTKQIEAKQKERDHPGHSDFPGTESINQPATSGRSREWRADNAGAVSS